MRVALLVAFLGTFAADAQAQTVDPNRWYRLRNAHLGDGRSLDTYSNGNNDPFMAATGPQSGQRWKITPLGGGQYRITNDFLGECRSLDTYSSNENRPTTGRLRFTNAFLGTGRSLDTYSGTVNSPFMGTSGAFTGQRWSLTLGPVTVLPSSGTSAPLRVGDTFTRDKLTVRVLNRMGPLYRVQIDVAP
jgi:hypothetical protein